ncbi:hypothetical protein [Nonomuraea fuscirosea]|uniref:hypothetical protein n=1 Tax=Nonomuraea fuscirosea TaxID=1291556 RepID=UPI0033E3BDE7
MDVEADQGLRAFAYFAEMVEVSVGLAQPGQTLIGDDLDNGTEGPRLVDSGGVEKRRIPESDGGDMDLPNDHFVRRPYM